MYFGLSLQDHLQGAEELLDLTIARQNYRLPFNM